MTVKQLYLLLLAVFIVIVSSSGAWEFWLEAYLHDYSDQIISHDNTGHHWVSLLATIIFSLTALGFAGVVAQRIIVSNEKMHTIFDETLASLEERVRSRTDELEKTVEMLKAENERRIQMEQELKRANEIAEQANQVKSVFLSRMSHELHTPMNAIMGFTSVLREDLKDRLTDTQTEYLDEIYSSSQRLLKMIDKMLKLSMLDTGDLEIVLEEVNLREVVDECLTLVNTLAANKHIEINPDAMAGCRQMVKADRHYLAQVIYNLLSNAIRHNRDNGEVSLWYDEFSAQNTLRLNVRDSGEGMTQERLAEIFTPFSWKSYDDFMTGTGISLTVTKQLVELMGGSIGVASIPGKGSNFWIDMDIADPRA